jgi:hypothetical protein
MDFGCADDEMPAADSEFRGGGTVISADGGKPFDEPIPFGFRGFSPIDKTRGNNGNIVSPVANQASGRSVPVIVFFLRCAKCFWAS